MRTLESARRDHAICKRLIKEHGSITGAMNHCTEQIASQPNNLDSNRAWSDRLARLRGIQLFQLTEKEINK